MDSLSQCFSLMKQYSGLGDNFVVASCLQIHGTLFSPYLAFVTNPPEGRNDMITFRMGHMLIAEPNIGKTRAINFVVRVVDKVWFELLRRKYNITEEEYSRIRSYFLISEGSMEMFAKNIQNASQGIPFNVNDEQQTRRRRRSNQESIIPEENRRIFFNQFLYFNDEFGKNYTAMAEGDYTYKLLTFVARLMTQSIYSDNTMSRGRIYIDGRRVVVNAIVGLQYGHQLQNEFFDSGFSRRFLPVYEENKTSKNLYRAYSRDDEIVDQIANQLIPIVTKMDSKNQKIMVLPDSRDTESSVESLLNEDNYVKPVNQYVPMFLSIISTIAGVHYTGDDFTYYSAEDIRLARLLIERVYIPSILRLYEESKLSFGKVSRDYYYNLRTKVLQFIARDHKYKSWTTVIKQFNQFPINDIANLLISLVNSGEVICRISEGGGHRKSLSFMYNRSGDHPDDTEVDECIAEIKRRISF